MELSIPPNKNFKLKVDIPATSQVINPKLSIDFKFISNTLPTRNNVTSPSDDSVSSGKIDHPEPSVNTTSGYSESRSDGPIIDLGDIQIEKKDLHPKELSIAIAISIVVGWFFFVTIPELDYRVLFWNEEMRKYWRFTRPKHGDVKIKIKPDVKIVRRLKSRDQMRSELRSGNGTVGNYNEIEESNEPWAPAPLLFSLILSFVTGLCITLQFNIWWLWLVSGSIVFIIYKVFYRRIRISISHDLVFLPRYWLPIPFKRHVVLSEINDVFSEGPYVRIIYTSGSVRVFTGRECASSTAQMLLRFSEIARDSWESL